MPLILKRNLKLLGGFIGNGEPPPPPPPPPVYAPGHGRHRRSLPRGTTWKLTVQTEKRPGPPVATHNSEETAAVEKSRKDVETVTWKPHSQVNVIRTAQTNRTDDSDILHAHPSPIDQLLFLAAFRKSWNVSCTSSFHLFCLKAKLCLMNSSDFFVVVLRNGNFFLLWKGGTKRSTSVILSTRFS